MIWQLSRVGHRAGRDYIEWPAKSDAKAIFLDPTNCASAMREVIKADVNHLSDTKFNIGGTP